MNAVYSQLSLFGPDQHVERAQADAARTWMREMIGRLSATSTPPWKDQMAVIPDEGAYQRAMRFVPPEKAEALWSKFDTHMDRLCAIWLAARGQPNE